MRQIANFVTLGVRDLSRSRVFYQALGWKESSSSPAEVAFFNAGTVVFGLFQREALAEDANVSSEGSGFPGFTLAHNVESEEAVVRPLGNLWRREPDWYGRPKRYSGQNGTTSTISSLLRNVREQSS